MPKPSQIAQTLGAQILTLLEQVQPETHPRAAALDNLDVAVSSRATPTQVLAQLQSELGSPSGRTNLQTILALLGNPDVADATLWNLLMRTSPQVLYDDIFNRSALGGTNDWTGQVSISDLTNYGLSPYSLLLTTPAEIGGNATAYRLTLPLPPRRKVALEVWWYNPTPEYHENLTFDFYLYDADYDPQSIRMLVKHTHPRSGAATHKWVYYNGDYADVPDGTQQFSVSQWHRFKMLCDLKTVHNPCIIESDGKTMTIPDPSWTSGESAERKTSLEISFTTSSADATYLHLGRVRVTYDDPAKPIPYS